jgi:hypothetical protein
MALSREQQLKIGREILRDYRLPTDGDSDSSSATRSGDQKKSVGGFLGNVIKSGGSFIKNTAVGLANIVNPDSQKNTVANIGRIGLGAVEKVIPGRQGAEDQFDTLADFYKHRYGSVDEFLDTLYNDPVGVAADASVVLGGAGSLLRGAGAASKVSVVAKAGNVASKVGRVVDPLRAVTSAARGVTRVGSETLGATTGAGFGAVREGFEAAAEGGARGKAFRGALRSPGTGEEILQNANTALDNLYEQRRGTYQSNLQNLEKDTYVNKKGQLYIRKVLTGKDAEATKGYKAGTPILVPTKLTTKGFKDTLTGTFKEIGIEAKGGAIDFSKRPSLDAKNLQTVSDLVYSWDDLTPTGVDQLLQEVRGFRKGGLNLGPAEKRFNYVVDRLADNLKKYSEDRVPQLKPLREDFAKQTRVIDEIRKELSIGDKKSVDSGIRKLSSVMRQNNEFRLQLVKQLQEAGGKELTSQIAGAALSPALPRGIIKPIIAGGGILGALTFGMIVKGLPALLAASPRVVGEFVNALGAGTGLVRKSGLPTTVKPAARAGLQSERARNQQNSQANPRR